MGSVRNCGTHGQDQPSKPLMDDEQYPSVKTSFDNSIPNVASHNQHRWRDGTNSRGNEEKPPVGESLRARPEIAERRIKRHWYPFVLLTMFLNISLLMSSFYIIYAADEYATNRQRFLGAACAITFAPLLPACLLLFSPWPYTLKRHRSAFSERDPSPRWKNIVNILAALASFTIAICYLLLSAIPTYNTPIWESSVEFLDQVPVPAIAFVLQHIDGSGRPLPINYTFIDGMSATSVTYTGFDVQSTTDTPGGVYQELIEQHQYGSFTAIVANNSALSSESSSPMGTGIAVTVYLTYNSTRAEQVPGYVPQLIFAIFDARIPVSAILECGLVQPPAVSAFTDNTVLLSMTQITDPYRIISPAGDAPAFCEDIYQKVMSDENRPLTLFNSGLTSSSPVVDNYREDCNVASNSNLVCRSSVTMVYGSQFVQRQRSIPGRSKQSIWIDIGAIVGAVQFFTWLVMIFFHG